MVRNLFDKNFQLGLEQSAQTLQWMTAQFLVCFFAGVVKLFIFRKELFAGNVPANNTLFAGFF